MHCSDCLHRTTNLLLYVASLPACAAQLWRTAVREVLLLNMDTGHWPGGSLEVPVRLHPADGGGLRRPCQRHLPAGLRQARTGAVRSAARGSSYTPVRSHWCGLCSVRTSNKDIRGAFACRLLHEHHDQDKAEAHDDMQCMCCVGLPAGAPGPLPGDAPAPSPLLACPGGGAPLQWNCSHLGQAFLWDAATYADAAPLAVAQLCFGVGVTNVLCGGTTMEAVAYEAR